MGTRILIMGLPGSGKTFLSNKLKEYIETHQNIVDWFNADEIRKKFNDWDFSHEGRIRQSIRMRELADNSKANYVICDFIAPLVEMRNNFKADWTIWVDTIKKGKFEDTNKVFVDPDIYDFRITEQNAEKWAKFIGDHILNNQRRPIFDSKKETVQLLGRYQPWHPGHRALFEKAFEKTGQVCIMVRDCQGWNGTNPFTFEQVESLIRRDLDPIYQGRYKVIEVPNITEICYGRDVGYSINKIELPEEIQQISATKIRKEMEDKGIIP